MADGTLRRALVGQQRRCGVGRFPNFQRSDWSRPIDHLSSCISAFICSPRKALALHFEGLVADGEELPQPQSIDLHLTNPDYAGGVWAVIEFDVTPYLGKAVRFNATLPEHLLQRIDDRVSKDQRYSSRSGFLATAALRELAQS